MRSFDQFLHEYNRTFTTGGDPGNRRVTGATDEKKYGKTDPDEKARARRSKLTAQDKKDENLRKQREANKPTLKDVNIRKGEEDIKDKQQKRAARIENQKIKQAKADKDKRQSEFETAQAKVSSKEKLAQQIRGKGKYKPEKINDPKKFGVGGAARNLARAGTNLARNAAAISTNLSARKDRKEVGRLQMQKGQAPSQGTTKQKIGFATKPVRQAVGNAATSVRRTTGRGIEKVGSGMSKVGNKIAGKPVSKPVSNPVKRARPSTPVQGPSQQGAVKKIRRFKGQVMQDHYNYNEDFIGEAEKKGEKKKEKIDVMKGTNKVEVNPKMQAEAKKMTKKQIKKRDEIADAISTREMNKRYGDKNVKYAIATKLAMKKKKKIDEAKIDQTMTGYEKRLARNERESGKKYEPVDSYDKPGTKIPKTRLTKWDQEYRRERHKEKRGVKKVKGNMTLKDRAGQMRGMTKANQLANIAKHAKNINVTGVKKYKDGSSGGTTEYSHYEPKGPVVMESGLEVQNVSDGLKFREYEFIDIIKPEPLVKARSVQEISECWKTHKQVGYKKKGGRMVPNCVPKNEEVENEKTINEISGELADKAFKAANRKYQYADNNLTRERAYKQQKKFSGYASKKYQKLNKDRGDLNKIYNKPDAVKEEVLNELSPNTLSTYIQRASDDVAGRSHMQGRKIERDFYGPKSDRIFYKKNRALIANERKKQAKKIDNRIVGTGRAARKLRDKARPEGEEARLNNRMRQSIEGGSKPKPPQKKEKLKPSDPRNAFAKFDEAKMPVKGLMKLAATVAANNKKRKNALQIQKYIGEDKKMGRQSDEDLSAARDKFSKMDQSMPSNQFMLKRINKEINRRKKANPKPDVTTEGKGSNPNKRYIGDPNVTSKKQFTKTGAIGVEITNPDEEQGIQQRRNAKEREREEKRKEIERKKEKKRQQRQGGNTDT